MRGGTSRPPMKREGCCRTRDAHLIVSRYRSVRRSNQIIIETGALVKAPGDGNCAGRGKGRRHSIRSLRYYAATAAAKRGTPAREALEGNRRPQHDTRWPARSPGGTSPACRDSVQPRTTSFFAISRASCTAFRVTGTGRRESPGHPTRCWSVSARMDPFPPHPSHRSRHRPHSLRTLPSASRCRTVTSVPRGSCTRTRRGMLPGRECVAQPRQGS